MECVIFIGSQASGKSSFFKECFFNTHVRINLDMLKTRHRESRFLETCIETQQPFVVDNTNPQKVDRSRYIQPARQKGFSIVGFYFQSRLTDALRRNSLRAEEERIPDKGIRGTHARLEIPTWSEGFDALHYVRIQEGCGFTVEEWLDEV